MKSHRFRTDEVGDSLRQALRIGGARPSYLEGCESMKRVHQADCPREKGAETAQARYAKDRWQEARGEQRGTALTVAPGR